MTCPELLLNQRNGAGVVPGGNRIPAIFLVASVGQQGKCAGRQQSDGHAIAAARRRWPVPISDGCRASTSTSRYEHNGQGGGCHALRAFLDDRIHPRHVVGRLGQLARRCASRVLRKASWTNALRDNAATSTTTTTVPDDLAVLS